MSSADIIWNAASTLVASLAEVSMKAMPRSSAFFLASSFRLASASSAFFLASSCLLASSSTSLRFFSATNAASSAFAFRFASRSLALASSALRAASSSWAFRLASSSRTFFSASFRSFFESFGWSSAEDEDEDEAEPSEDSEDEDEDDSFFFFAFFFFAGRPCFALFSFFSARFCSFFSCILCKISNCRFLASSAEVETPISKLFRRAFLDSRMSSALLSNSFKRLSLSCSRCANSACRSWIRRSSSGSSSGRLITSETPHAVLPPAAGGCSGTDMSWDSESRCPHPPTRTAHRRQVPCVYTHDL
mmetsp:Transcript_30342/g.68352  ORF Transcript_30342/g.68352 Transcript_30342/m.68352 type:complete len:305 (+) Transcript_30342:254-1168(+)